MCTSLSLAFSPNTNLVHYEPRHQQDALTNSIRLLNSLAIKLKAKRMAAGALNLASPEVKIHLDSAESSDPIDVEQKELRETNSLVEEFMLLANISVARKIQETFVQTAVLRYGRLTSGRRRKADAPQTPSSAAEGQFQKLAGHLEEAEGA